MSAIRNQFPVRTAQVSYCGAVLTFAGEPLFANHLALTPARGLSALSDQQLGGLIMWVPSLVFFLLAAWRTLVALLTEEAAETGKG